MQQIFRMLNKAYQNNEFWTIFNHQDGNYFLKLRSLSRTEILRNLAETAEIKVDNIQGRQLFEHLFCQNIPQAVIDNFIRRLYQRERAERVVNEDNLYTQLYRLQVFDWGGFYQNAVEQTIVQQLCEENTRL